MESIPSGRVFPVGVPFKFYTWLYSASFATDDSSSTIFTFSKDIQKLFIRDEVL